MYVNLDNPNIFLIFFEDSFGEKIDRDYNDLVISLELISCLKISNITRTPENPNYNQGVTVAAQVFNATCNIDKVFLSYQINHGSWTNLTMFLEKSAYLAAIPSQSYGTLVTYKISVSDIIGNSKVSEVFSYTIGDFVPPKILKIIQVPELPKPNESVKIWVILDEPQSASGVKNVTIWCYNNIDWFFIIMKLDNGICTWFQLPSQIASV